MTLFRRSVSLLVTAVALVGCSEPTSPGPPAELTALPRALSAAEQKVLAAGNVFAFSLFGRINAAQRDSNVFISPLSASMALGMTLNGAAGTTYEAMRATLGFADASPEQINEGYQTLIALLRGLDPHTEFTIANSIWYRNDFPFEQSFLATGRTFFEAEMRGLDFDNAGPSLATINGWVDRSTKGKIKQIVERIDRDHVMFLINAIYFKGSWRQRFDPRETRDAPFHAFGGTRSARLMHVRGTLRYHETPMFQAVDLLYGNSAFAMTVLLPKPGGDVNALASALGEAQWKQWTDAFTEREVDLYLPKFKLEYERVLNDDLEALEMGIAFRAGAADFTRMSAAAGRKLYIDYVKQKTYVDVYEEGTEAAAATVVAVGVVCACGPPVMRVDRPFVFVIRERFSGTILFMGKIVRIP